MARPKKNDGVVYKRKGTKVWWMRYSDKGGARHSESTGKEDWQEAQSVLRKRLEARDQNILEVVRKGERLLFREWAEFFLQNYSQPPLRAAKTHAANGRAMKHLTASFASQALSTLSADSIELYLRSRLKQRVCRQSLAGPIHLGLIKPTTVHQEFRVLRRALNVAVRKKLLVANPCMAVEFPVAVKGLFKPHYVTWSEQQQIEFRAPAYLANVVRIITETGLRVYQELACMRKDQVDLANAVIWIPDSKTPSGIAEVPLTEYAHRAFQSQLLLAGEGLWLFPSDENPTGHQKTFKTAWQATLRRAGIPYFRIYDLRSTYATRLSAGGVADEWVIQLLRQTDAKVFKKYSQMKLQMKRKALLKINRQASELGAGFDTGRPN